MYIYIAILREITSAFLDRLNHFDRYNDFLIAFCF